MPVQWNDCVVVPVGLQLAPRSNSSPVVARSSPWSVGGPGVSARAEPPGAIATSSPASARKTLARRMFLIFDPSDRMAAAAPVADRRLKCNQTSTTDCLHTADSLPEHGYLSVPRSWVTPKSEGLTKHP